MNWGKIKIPKVPVHNYADNELQQRQYNVMVSSILAGSAKKVLDSIAYDLALSKWGDSGANMFNVTLMTSQDCKLKKKKLANLHFIDLDYDSSNLITENGPQFK